MATLPKPQYTVWQAVAAFGALALRAIDEVRALARIPGPQGERGERGRDGLSIEDMEPIEEAMRFGVRFKRGDIVKDLWWSKPTLADFDAGVWKHDEQYRRGVGVSYGGSWWIAKVAPDAMTTERPGNGSKDWRLAVKSGRDGKDGRDGAPGPIGPVGPPGRDLTQMTFEGQKF